MDYPYPIKGDDKIYINRKIGEVLLFPSDESQDESWIQDCIINRRNSDRKEDSVLYSKSDSLKLEQFLRREQEGTVIIIKRKCLEHLKPCEAFNILSKRQESNRENKLIRSIWDSVESITGTDGQKRIQHSYVHRHDVAKTFPPHKSNVKEAITHAKKVIYKAKREGSLDALESQVEKMVEKGAFVQLSADQIMELADTPHLFTQYNWVMSPGSASTPFRMITNTSSIHSGTTISVEQMSPSKVLNPMTNSLVRF